jgi:hypothetical protein
MTAQNSTIAAADASGTVFQLDAVDLAVNGPNTGPRRPVHAPAGSVGRDWTANPIVIPNVGAAFADDGPYAGYALIKTVPANPGRVAAGAQTLSGDRVVIVRDDGTASPGSSPTNATVLVLEGGPAFGAKGDSWQSATFRGRLQIYAAVNTAFVSVWED